MSGHFVDELLACFGASGGGEDSPGDTPQDEVPTAPPPPPPPPAAPGTGSLQISPLYGDARYDEFFSIRRCAYELNYKVPPNILRACIAKASEIETATVARVKDAVERAVENMRAGLGTEEKPGKLSYSQAEKDILDPLNKTIQNEIDSILDAATKAFQGLGAGAALETDAVARFAKFRLLAHLSFPGGGEPSANREKIKPLLSDLSEMLAAAKGLTTDSALIGYVAGEFLADWRKAQGMEDETTQPPQTTTTGTQTTAPKKPPPRVKELEEEQLNALRPLQNDLDAKAKDYAENLDKLDKLHGQLEKLVKQIERINKKEGDASVVEADKKAYGAVERSLKQFASGAQRLQSAMADSAAACDTLRALIQMAFENDTPVRLDQAAKGLKGSDIEVQAQILERQAADLIAKITED